VKNRFIKSIFFILLLNSTAFSGKALLHFISLPVIEGAGIYVSVKSLTDNNSSSLTKAASITNLSILGANASLGVITMISADDTRYKLRTIHRIAGITLSAASLWLSISNSIDHDAASTRYVSYGYTVLTVFPIIIFRF